MIIVPPEPFLATAYNLVRMAKLITPTASPLQAT